MDHRFNTPAGWDATAEEYSKANSPTQLYVEQVIELAQIESLPAESSRLTLLDVAAGPGVLSLPLGEKIAKLKKEGRLEGKTIQLIASDFSPKMVEMIATKLEKSHSDLKDIVLPRVLDGMALALENNSIDAVFSTFSILLFPDRSKGFAELYRVLKPGGIAVVTSWKQAGGAGITVLLEAIMKLHFSQHPHLAPPARPQSKTPLSEPHAFEEEFKAAGFCDIVIHERTCEWRFSQDQFIPMVKNNPMIEFIKQIVGGYERFEELAKQVLQEMFPGATEGVLPTFALIGVARK